MSLQDFGARRVGALVWLVLFLALQAFAASGPLHKALHHDADSPGHECAITLLAHGQIDAPLMPALSPAFVAAFHFFLPALTAEAFSSVKYQFSASRAPPVV